MFTREGAYTFLFKVFHFLNYLAIILAFEDFLSFLIQKLYLLISFSDDQAMRYELHCLSEAFSDLNVIKGKHNILMKLFRQLVH